MDKEKPVRPTKRSGHAADCRGAAVEQGGAPDDARNSPARADHPDAPATAGFDWPAAGISLQFGLTTVTGMAVHEGPPFYRLS